MASISSYHSRTLTFNSDELLEVVYCDLVPILFKRTTQIGYVVDLNADLVQHWPRMSYIGLIGEKSGDLVGHSRTSILFCRKTSWVCPAVFGRALAC
jgi:hypothetical protein